MTRLAGRMLPWWRRDLGDVERLWFDDRAREDNKRSRWFAVGQLAVCFAVGFVVFLLTASLVPWIVDDGRSEPVLGLPREIARVVSSIGLLVAYVVVGFWIVTPLRRLARLASICHRFGVCDRCGQSLEGLKASQTGFVRCPECGLDRPVVRAWAKSETSGGA